VRRFLSSARFVVPRCLACCWLIPHGGSFASRVHIRQGSLGGVLRQPPAACLCVCFSCLLLSLRYLLGGGVPVWPFASFGKLWGLLFVGLLVGPSLPAAVAVPPPLLQEFFFFLSLVRRSFKIIFLKISKNWGGVCERKFLFQLS
jgi:hypothetical protein